MPKRRPPSSQASPTERGRLPARVAEQMLISSGIRRSPAGLKGEMRVSQCRACGKQTKIIVARPQKSASVSFHSAQARLATRLSQPDPIVPLLDGAETNAPKVELR